MGVKTDWDVSISLCLIFWTSDIISLCWKNEKLWRLDRNLSTYLHEFWSNTFWRILKRIEKSFKKKKVYNMVPGGSFIFQKGCIKRQLVKGNWRLSLFESTNSDRNPSKSLLFKIKVLSIECGWGYVWAAKRWSWIATCIQVVGPVVPKYKFQIKDFCSLPYVLVQSNVRDI